ncbi:hypothetical protein [Alteromonas macleodii]|uniref:hypothetical protein n=1 Tax=Alteromonas macleodii TaxID=28108 RepID=UPI0008596959|nr:hypothetical protein [Alteromonas macleodii]
MANTTDIIITCAAEDDVIDDISRNTGVLLKKITDTTKSGGNKDVWFESYAACYSTLEVEEILRLIQIFKNSEFSYPEFAVLIISDDNTPKIDGVYRPETAQEDKTSESVVL